MIGVSSINGHVKIPEGWHLDSVGVLGAYFVVKVTKENLALQTYYNSEGREVFKVEYFNPEKPCSVKSFVASVITRLVGRRKTSTPRT